MSPPCLGVEGLNLDLHRLAFLAFVGVGSRLDAVLGRAGLFIVCGLGRVGGFSFGCLGGLRLGGSAGFLLGGDRRDFLVARQRRDFVDRGVVDQARLGDFDLFDLQSASTMPAG